MTFRKELQEREKELTTELSESERRASKMAEIVPVGIYELAMDGTLQWANNQFFEIMGVPNGQRNKESFVWIDHVVPQDHDRANQKMAAALLQGIDVSDNLRLRRKWTPPESDDDPQVTVEPYWILYSASPNFGPDGTICSLTGSMTDISHLKWAEQLQLRNAETARKERRIQEEFIDITSHEMRNPLSAITQSADGILLSLQDAKKHEDAQSLRDLIRLNAEAAESILFCAAHQRRIIDDILTLGKLDSKLLTICPAAFQMEDLIDQTMQMFKAEFEANRIQMQTSVDVASSDKGPTTFNGDASRLLQVLVNMMTNAIKFTKTQLRRNISIRYGSSLISPMASLFGPNFKWYSTKTSRPDLTQEPEYGHGLAAYVYFAVTDSGEGIPSDALERIFTKFEQADRRTHTKYGGSGLGLYISRELTEMQGGCIGIESAVGVGSTFAFYAKVRRLETLTSPEHLLADLTCSSSSTRTLAFKSSSFSETPSLPTSRPPQDHNILLVEDNALNQTVLATQLRRAGCHVQISNHGGEAVDAILRLHDEPVEYGSLPPDDSLPHFDCILMDWEMPVCDGIQATKTIRRIETQRGAARSLIIGVTANARAEQIAKSIEAGMNSVLPKPFRVAELLAKINDLTSVHTA
jgi:signal transduction histidine kinase/CheY-like chemotaxis protein